MIADRVINMNIVLVNKIKGGREGGLFGQGNGFIKNLNSIDQFFHFYTWGE